MTGEELLYAFHRGDVSIKINNASAEELNKLQNILGTKLSGGVDLFNFYFEKDTDHYIFSITPFGNRVEDVLAVSWFSYGEYEFTMEQFFSFFDDEKIHEDDFLEVFQ